MAQSDSEQNGSEIQNGSSFDEYSGRWSYEGKTHKQILDEGGIEFWADQTASFTSIYQIKIITNDIVCAILILTTIYLSVPVLDTTWRILTTALFIK